LKGLECYKHTQICNIIGAPCQVVVCGTMCLQAAICLLTENVSADVRGLFLIL